jgi:bacillithiol system protein YtxJ
MGLFSFGKGGSGNTNSLNWTQVETVESLKTALAKSTDNPVLFFKHSTRCSISSMALNRFEKEWNESDSCEIYFIDLIAHRDVSNALSDLTEIPHQSPQVIVVNQGKSVYNASHSGIDAEDIQSNL